LRGDWTTQIRLIWLGKLDFSRMRSALPDRRYGHAIPEILSGRPNRAAYDKSLSARTAD
jgi:hypothetical protein